MKTTTIIFVFILSTLFAYSQPMHMGGKNYEKIQAKKIEFIKEELQLTEKEEADFVPLYNEMTAKKRAIHKKRRKIMKNFKKNSLNLSNEDMIKMSDDFILLEDEMHKISQEYHIKFKEVLPPVKVLMLYRSEYEFKRHLLKKMKRHGRPVGKNSKGE